MTPRYLAGQPPPPADLHIDTFIYTHAQKFIHHQMAVKIFIVISLQNGGNI